MLFFAVLLLATAAYLIVYLRNYILIPYKRLNRMIHAVESQLRQQQMETETERKYFNKIGKLFFDQLL
jgi:nitrate/nitrite-specific signal transduction histidine kinase